MRQLRERGPKCRDLILNYGHDKARAHVVTSRRQLVACGEEDGARTSNMALDGHSDSNGLWPGTAVLLCFACSH